MKYTAPIRRVDTAKSHYYVDANGASPASPPSSVTASRNPP
jgi:hypothetical protein